MKQILSKNQVNANLKRMDAKNAVCYSIVYNRYTDQPTFYIWKRGVGVVVVENKMVYWHLFKEPLRGDETITKFFRGMECREYILRSRYSNRVNKSEKEAVEKILLCCGMKAEKKINEVTPEQRLRQLDSGLHEVYKVMIGLTGIRGELETRYKANRYGLERPEYAFMALVIYHDKGFFSFPIENIVKDEAANEEIQNIFFNALNLPVTSKLKTA